MAGGNLESCPTPWCKPEHEKYIWQGPDDLFCVICDGCQVEGPSCENEGDARDAWNTRATDTQVSKHSELVEVIADALLSAFLAGRGSITARERNAYKPEPTMDHFRNIARAALTDTQVSKLREAIKPFVDLKAQKGAWSIIENSVQGMEPVTVTVTKAQMLALARAALTGDSQNG